MKVRLLRRASKDLLALGPQERTRVLAKLKGLESSPFSFDVKKLTSGQDYRLRVGDHRILFVIEGDLIIVVRIAHRREIYR